MKKRYLLPFVFLGVFFLGPRAHYADFDGQLLEIKIPLDQLDDQIANKEGLVANIKPENKSQIIWADSIRKTPFSVVYLHGFSASPREGGPIHKEFAKRYGANLYIPRLVGHGLQDDDSFLTLTPKELIESAKEAVAIGQMLGDSVILMSCSTGSTLALYLAGENPDAFHSLILYSPNIDIYDKKSELLTLPYGEHLAQWLLGDHNHIPAFKGNELENYWTTTYSTNGVICLKYLLEHSMTKDVLSKVEVPYFLGYYYKDEAHFDHVVSIDKMKWFHKISATPESKKKMKAFPNTGHHVMNCDLLSKDLESVRLETWDFADNILGLKSKTETTTTLYSQEKN